MFIGNSFTYVNGMPGKLIQIASSDATNKIQLEVVSVTKGGASLAYMFGPVYNDRNLLFAIADRYRWLPRHILKSRHWDYLVLQEQSEWTGSQERIDQTYSAVNHWNQAARQAGARPILYETWADKAGSPFYTKKGESYFFGQNPDEVQENIDAQSSALAKHFDMAVVAVGNRWAYAEKQPNAPELYANDYHHPSVAGAYLTALIFYRTFTGNTPRHITYRPPELTSEQAQFLIDVASR